jgi:uncharacterized protein
MSNIIQLTRDMVSGYMSGFDPSHDMYHVDRVTRLGSNLTTSILSYILICAWSKKL